MVAASAIVIAILLSPLFAKVSAQFDTPTIILHTSFVDLNGKVNVVGTVRNYDPVPVHVAVGLLTADGRTLEADTYGRTIWPLTDSPFKFVLQDGDEVVGSPFLSRVEEAKTVRYEMLLLTYDGMAVGQERAFVGKLKNTGPFEIKNVSVFAAVHSADHRYQLDTVRSSLIPVIRPGEVLDFVAVPDPTIRPDVLYYSCAGVDYDEPITTVKVGNGKFLAYDLSAVAEVRNLRYDSSTDSLAFGIRPYGPTGSALTLKIPQQTSNQTVNVIIDGNAQDSSLQSDGRTMTVEFHVPQGEHDIQIQGVRNVPEFPYPFLVLGSVVAAVLASARSFKAAFKIS